MNSRLAIFVAASICISAFAAAPNATAANDVHIRFRQESNNPRHPSVEANGEDAVSCLIQIDSDNSRGGERIEAQALQQMLNTTALQETAIQRMLAKNPEIHGQFTISSSSPSSRMIRLEVFPEAGDKAAAQAMESALVETLQAAIDESNQATALSTIDSRKQIEQQIAGWQEKLDGVEKKLGPLRSKGSMLLEVQNLQQQSMATQQDLVGKRARLEAINDWMKKHPVDKNAIPSTQPAKSAPVIGAGGRSYFFAARIEDEVPQLEVSIIEAEARQKVLEEQISKLTGGKSPAEVAGQGDDVGQLSMEENRLRNEIQNLQNQLENYKRQVPASVKLTVLDGRLLLGH